MLSYTTYTIDCSAKINTLDDFLLLFITHFAKFIKIFDESSYKNTFQKRKLSKALWS